MKKSTIATLCLLTTLAHAEEIRLDFNDSYSPGGNWNVATNVADSRMNDLIAYGDGSATTADVTWTFASKVSRDSWTAGEKDWVNDAVADDCFYSSSSQTVTFANLTANAYKVEVLISYNADRATTYRIGGNGADATYNGTPVSDPWNWQADGLNDGNWMIWNAVDTSSGSFSVDMTTTQVSGISAIRIQAIPEPATLGMISAFGGAIILIRRKFML